ncbi:hypothetical protein K1719_046740 [Acacia pycnantha]|nr:hypothetical protein K1719_046740 [Acacia pycnantha]
MGDSAFLGKSHWIVTAFVREITSSVPTTMEETEINGAAPYLPEEIITNILMRLPVKSLIRFRCVCKYWENLFKTPFFIATHLRQSHKNPFLIFSPDYPYNNIPLRLLDCEMQLRDVQKAPLFHSLVSALSVYIIGSINGLLCFVTLSTLVNDYKILVIYALYSDGMVCGVDVYSLNEGSWKEIEAGNLFEISYASSTVSCNGAIFIYGLKLGKEEIVSFDIATEVFTFISWPPLSGDPSFNLTVYEDKLALLTTSAIGASSKVDLWVMEEGMSSSEEGWNWIKKFTSDSYPWEFTPCTIWRNEIVVYGIEIEVK